MLASIATARQHHERQTIQIIFQNPERSLNPNETVAMAIQRPLRLFGLADRRTERTQAAAFRAYPVAQQYAGPLPARAVRRRSSAIARALAAPSVLLCDEFPLDDVSTQAAIVTTGRNRGYRPHFFSSRTISLVHSIPDRILVLETGEIRGLVPPPDHCPA
jgi:peptide/nickel transport system ATP-binding protein